MNGRLRHIAHALLLRLHVLPRRTDAPDPATAEQLRALGDDVAALRSRLDEVLATVAGSGPRFAELRDSIHLVARRTTLQRRLVKLLDGIKGKVNLLPLNAAPGIPFDRPDDGRVDAFAKILADKGLTVSVRKSRGRDIRAACGQLIVDEGPLTPRGTRSPAQALADRL